MNIDKSAEDIVRERREGAKASYHNCGMASSFWTIDANGVELGRAYCGAMSDTRAWEDAERNTRPAVPKATTEPVQISSKSDIDPSIKLLADVMHLWVDGYISKNPHSAAPASICNATFDGIKTLLDTQRISVDYMGWEVKHSASAKSEEKSAAEQLCPCCNRPL